MYKDVLNSEFQIPKQLQREGFGFVKLRHKTKKPFETDWQKNPYNFTEITGWIKLKNNYGVIGGHGGLIIIDQDKPEIRKAVEAKLPPTFTVKSSGEKRHSYYFNSEFESKIVIQTSPKDEDHYGEIISFGSQVVGPGSIHPGTNKPYEVVNDIEIASVSKEDVLSALADYLPIDTFAKKDHEAENNCNLNVIDILTKFGVQTNFNGKKLQISHPIHGSKNGCNFVADSVKNFWYCFRCKCGGGAMSLIAVLEGIIDCSQAVAGGLRGDNFLKTKDIACKKYGLIINNGEYRGKAQEQDSQAKKLINFVKNNENIKLFHDQTGEPYIAISDKNQKIMKLSSNNFKRWLSSSVWKETKLIVNQNSISNATNILSGEACNDGDLCELKLRVAWHEESLFYDLGDGSVVKINKDGWEILENPPILFYRFNHQKKQAHPQKEGCLEGLLNFINLKDEGEKLLFQIYVVASFLPDIAHPLLVSHGPHGSAKSTMHKIIKSIVDPSNLGISSPPDNMREFIQTASHHWIIPLDNLSFLTWWMSDALCRVCTGGGFSKRELYTNDDDIIYNFKHVATLNGINLVASKPDLLDRSILLAHDTIPPEKRKREEEMLEEFEKAKPLILGSIFDILTKAIKEKINVKAKTFPRLADFAHWGCAITIAMGRAEEDFLKAYSKNISQQNDEAIDASIIGQTVIEFMENQDSWTGSPTELLEELNELAEKLKINTHSNYWPQGANAVWKRINEVKVNLEVTGIKAEKTKSGKRKITLWKTKKDTDQTVQTVQTVQTHGEIPHLPDNMDSMDSSSVMLNKCKTCGKNWKNNAYCPHPFDADKAWELYKKSSKENFSSFNGKEKVEFFDENDNLLGEYIET